MLAFDGMCQATGRRSKCRRREAARGREPGAAVSRSSLGWQGLARCCGSDPCHPLASICQMETRASPGTPLCLVRARRSAQICPALAITLVPCAERLVEALALRLAMLCPHNKVLKDRRAPLYRSKHQLAPARLQSKTSKGRLEGGRESSSPITVMHPNCAIAHLDLPADVLQPVRSFHTPWELQNVSRSKGPRHSFRSTHVIAQPNCTLRAAAFQTLPHKQIIE